MDNIIKKPLDLKKVKPAVDLLRKYDIDIRAYVIVGLPGESIKQINNTFKLLRECKIYRFNPFLFSPLPGSDLYQKALDDDLISDEFDHITYNPYGRASFPLDVSQLELEKLAFGEYQKAVMKHLVYHPVNFFKTYSYSMYSLSHFVTKVINFFGYILFWFTKISPKSYRSVE
jgi:magnesium-protoporphyrin IX monomethyl ester (oxidative) cyclase